MVLSSSSWTSGDSCETFFEGIILVEFSWNCFSAFAVEIFAACRIVSETMIFSRSFGWEGTSTEPFVLIKAKLPS